jgi:starch-binding outer membrane protein, SusD/RagB family
MRKINSFNYSLLGVFLLLTSCMDYLERTPEAELSEEQIFGTYIDFQGFLDPNYPEIIDYPQTYLWNDFNMGGDVICRSGGPNAYRSAQGRYWDIVGPSNTSIFWNFRQTYGYGVAAQGDDKDTGIWYSGWRGIRRCNLALKNFHHLKEATQEERDLLLGQIYFFRAFFHGEIISLWGGMPYVDTVFAATDEMRLPRITYQETTERIIEDLDKAIPLLPLDWDFTGPGSQRVGANAGRITRGAALAYKQKFLLYAASPLMNKFSGGTATYNTALAEKAAAAGWEAIKVANTVLPNGNKVYELVPFSNYSDMFYKTDGTMPWTTETILQRVERQTGSGRFSSAVRRIYVPASFGGTEYCHGVNQLFVDRFEMADGTRYKEEYDNDDEKRWKNRDPRFRQNILVDRDKHGDHANAFVRLWEGPPAGSDKTASGQAPLPYLVKKYWPWGVNNYDQKWSSYRFINPRMRLAQVYLDYAESVTAAYGPNGKAPGSDLTAVDAINIVRARAGMPPVTADAAGYDSFMELVWNERSVELCFESHYWIDKRRWYIAHLPEHKEIIDLQFDKDWTYFNRTVHFDIVFEDPKHYWLPLYRQIVFLYPEMYQNPGWD